MKLFMFLILAGLIFVSHSSLGQGKFRINGQKIDSVVDSNYKFLKLQLTRRTSEQFIELSPDSLQIALEKEEAAINFFESITGIRAKIVHHYAYGKDYDAELLDQWKVWVDKNRELLQWDAINSTVIRSGG